MVAKTYYDLDNDRTTCALKAYMGLTCALSNTVSEDSQPVQESRSIASALMGGGQGSRLYIPYFHGSGALKKLWPIGLHLILGHNFFSLLLKTAKILGFSF